MSVKSEQMPRVRARRGAGRRAGWGPLGFEEAEEVAGDVALQAALDLAWGLAVGGAAGGVGAGGGVVHEAERTMVCSAQLSWRSPPRLRR